MHLVVSGATQGLVAELIVSYVYVQNSGTEWTLGYFTSNTRVVIKLECGCHSEEALHAGEMGWQDPYIV